MSLLDLLDSSVEGPVAEKIKFSKDVPATHPIRKADLHVRILPKSCYDQLLLLDTTVTASVRYWWTIVACVCDKQANPKMAEELAAACPSKPAVTVDGEIPVALATLAQERYKTPGAQFVFEQVWKAAMVFNGFVISAEENSAAKKSETTQELPPPTSSASDTELASDKPSNSPQKS